MNILETVSNLSDDEPDLVFLPQGDPNRLVHFSGIPFHFGRALKRVAGQEGIRVKTLSSKSLLNVEELLAYVAYTRGLNKTPPTFEPEQLSLTLNEQLLIALERANGLAIPSLVKDYYFEVARCLASELEAFRDLPVLTLGHLYPYLGGRVNASHYIDACLHDFFFDPERGVVPAAHRMPELVDLFEDFERETLSSSSRIYCFSDSLANRLRERFSLKDSQIKTVGAGPNIESIPEGSSSKKHSLTRLLFIGLDFERKGGRALLDALARLENEPFHLDVVTERIFHRELENVTFHAPCNAVQRGIFYRNADIFVFPTLFEPFGLVLCEAMAFGLPIIASNAGAIPEILLKDSGNAMIAVPQSGSGAELASTIRAFLKSKEAWPDLGAKNRERIRKSFTWDVAARRILHDIGLL